MVSPTQVATGSGEAPPPSHSSPSEHADLRSTKVFRALSADAEAVVGGATSGRVASIAGVGVLMAGACPAHPPAKATQHTKSVLRPAGRPHSRVSFIITSSPDSRGA